jgi:hypothetical protein
LLATSEGQAGIMAASLQECLELVIAHPYWQDVLRFGKGDLSAMRQVLRDKVEEFEEEALDDNPEIEEFRPGAASAARARRAARSPKTAASCGHGAWHQGDRSRFGHLPVRAVGRQIQRAIKLPPATALSRQGNNWRSCFPFARR